MLTQDNSILQIDGILVSNSMPEMSISETLPHCLQSQPELTLAIRTPAQTIRRFYFNPTSETEQSELQDKFQDAQGNQFSPTASELEHDPAILNPVCQALVLSPNPECAPGNNHAQTEPLLWNPVSGIQGDLP